MLNLIKEIESCVQNNYLRCALGMALTLPDICAHVEFPNEKNEKRYVAWCDKYLFNQGYITAHETDDSISSKHWKNNRVIDPEMCYKLRCAYLHSGNLELNQKKTDDFPFFNLQITSTNEAGNYGGMVRTNKAGNVEEITIDVRLLTRVLCNAAKEYYDNSPNKDLFMNHQVKITDMEKEWKKYIKQREQLSSIMMSKKEKYSYDELTDSAKQLLSVFQQGKKQEIKRMVENDDETVYPSIMELYYCGFLTVQLNEKQ